MSVPKGIRLYLRPARKDRAAVWIIRDGGREIGTGLSASEIEQANQKLAEYINDSHKPERHNGEAPTRVPVADVVMLYFEEHMQKKSRPDAAQGRVRKLVEFFGDKVLSEINSALCRQYAKERGSEQAARRELEDLRAAINFYFKDDLLPPRVNIELPEKAGARQRWLTEAEAAKLLLTAWRRTQPMPKGGRRHVSRHIARFILVGLYTGTRASAICGAAIRPTEGRGYVDLEKGVFYRRPPGTRESSKRQPFVRLPDKLLGHMRRWARLGLCENCVVEWEGESVKRVSKGFRQVADAAKLPDVTPHTLRHTAISWALQRGTKRFDVADYFGVSEKVIERTYGHHDPEHHKEVTTRMDRRRKAAPGA
jgi:integrase